MRWKQAWDHRSAMVRHSIVVLLCAVTCTVLSSATDHLKEDDARIPAEVRFKSGYVNPIPKPADFSSAMLWGIAIADVRVPGFENAQVEIARSELSCKVAGKELVLNDDRGNIRGGLYRRYPWFGTDTHDPLPLAYSSDHGAVILHIGHRPNRVWHFWAASPRAQIPAGNLAGCTVKVRARISSGALLQVGFDYWRNTSVGYGLGGNNHEAGASKWYLPSDKWQDAEFTDTRASSPPSPERRPMVVNAFCFGL